MYPHSPSFPLSLGHLPLLPAPHVHTARDGAGEVQALGPRAVLLAGDDFDFAEGLAEADDGVGGFGEGELLACKGVSGGFGVRIGVE